MILYIFIVIYIVIYVIIILYYIIFVLIYNIHLRSADNNGRSLNKFSEIESTLSL